MRKRIVIATLGVLAAAGVGTGVASAVTPASPSTVEVNAPDVSGAVDVPEAGDTPDPAGAADVPEAGDTPDASGAVDVPEAGDTPDASGAVDVPEAGDTPDAPA